MKTRRVSGTGDRSEGEIIWIDEGVMYIVVWTKTYLLMDTNKHHLVS